MASSRDDTKCNYFHQTIELHLDYGAEVLRKVIHTQLNKNGITLEDHLKMSKHIFDTLMIQKKLFQKQWDLLYPGKKHPGKKPDLSEFDISLLTLLLTRTNLYLSADEKNKVKDLRRERNHMSHLPKAELTDKTHFNVTSALITELSGIVSKKFTKEMTQNIAYLQRRAFVSCRSTLEIVYLRNEELMVMLIERPSTYKADESDTTYLKYGLTKWVKQFSRAIELDTFLMRLKDEGILTHTEKLEIETEYNKEEQSIKLIMKVIDGTNEKLWKFCSCLRVVNEHLADLIENKNDDGVEIDAKLKTIEDAKVLQSLKTNLKEDKSRIITSEKIHLLVEKELGYTLPYPVIEQIFLQEFGIRHADYSFQGLTLNDNATAELAITSEDPIKFSDTTAENKENLANMSGEKLAELVCEQCESVKAGIGPEIKKGIISECISPTLFIDMTKEELKECFSDYISIAKMPFGIVKTLENIQRQIRRAAAPDTEPNVTLRKFDHPEDNIVYKQGKVRPPDGNLMVPAHEFRVLPNDRELKVPYLIKECIRFIAACLNTRKNGTIHFGIQSIGNGCGLILGIGINLVSSMSASVNRQLKQAIEECFPKVCASVVRRCIRPLQVIPVEGGSYVLEIDVVPFSGYTKNWFFSVHFPPKGKQEKKLFVYTYEQPCEIATVPEDKEEEVRELYGKSFNERRSQESAAMKQRENTSTLASKLVSVLTEGSDYVTDQYTPIICCGKITGCDNETRIRETFDVPEAFLSSVAVFDFDSSVNLRNQVEKQDLAFKVITADDKNPEKNIVANSDRIWMYCNGNSDLKTEEMNLQDWYKYRFNAIQNIISLCEQRAPRQRVIVLFLAFDKTCAKDPLIELAEDCMKSKFRGQCVIVAEDNDILVELANKLSGIISQDEIEKYFHTGMKWGEISDTLRTVFRTTTQYDYKLPCSNGHFVIMTAEEKRQMNFTDIDIVSGEECKRLEMIDTDETRRKRKIYEQENFYKGRDVSWWNFYYQDQVGKRDLHTKFLKSAKDILNDESELLIEVFKIRHQPGAGGSTAGRYLLWQLSQFDNQEVRNAYRCCVIKQITEDTANQINNFLSFKDQNPSPVVILTDNENEEQLNLLFSTLNTLAYKHAVAGKLFCLHIEVNRVSVSYSERHEIVLTHLLSKPEQTWFETKYQQLEESNIDVETLIAFNVMRKSFDQMYITELADQIVSGVKDTEFDVLKCLSLINTYNRDDFIPVSIFDCLVSHNKTINGRYSISAWKNKGPIGLVVPMMGERRNAKSRHLWNVDVTDELALLIKKDSGNQSGVMIISQALAKAILDYVMKKENKTLRDMVEFILSIAENHVNEKNPMSKHFVKVINSLFITRSVLSTKGETKANFSDMVLALQQKHANENIDQANASVVRLMERCFEITSDALVGQQLSRFLINMNDFDRAERIIQLSCSLKPKRSYLLSTYGQVYRHKMKYMVSQTYPPISDEETVLIIQTAFQAIDKFVLGQKYSKSARELEVVDSTCFSMEVKVTLLLLASFKKFACYKDRDNFLAFLNKNDFDTETSSFREVAQKCAIEKLQKGSDTQKHTEESLRRLEEKEYQIKQYAYLADKFINEMQLQKFREKYEAFYGNKNHSQTDECYYVKGLKSLMKADLKNQVYVQGRVDEAKNNLRYMKENNMLEKAETSDLLVVLGYEIMQMSNGDPKTSPMGVEEYNCLLSYSEILLQHEWSSSRAYLEAFLFYAILHWPSEVRLQKVDSICKPTKYMRVLKEWKKHFDKNFDSKNKGKNYFVFGKGDLGCDIVDLDKCVRLPWIKLKKQTQNRKRPPVIADNFWKESFVVDRLERLTGKLDATGTSVEYQIIYRIWEYKLSIRTYYPCHKLSNRLVTFVLGFTWEGLAAFDVEVKEKSYHGKNGKDVQTSQTERKIGEELLTQSSRTINQEVDPPGKTIMISEKKREELETSNDILYGAAGGEWVQFKPPFFPEEREGSVNDRAVLELPQPDEEICDREYGAAGGDPLHFNQKVLSSERKEAPKQTKEKTDGSMWDGEEIPLLEDATEIGISADPLRPTSRKKNPVEALNDLRKGLKYTEETAGREIVIWVEVDGQIYETRGHNKKQVKQDVARIVLREHFKIDCEIESERASYISEGSGRSGKKTKRK